MSFTSSFLRQLARKLKEKTENTEYENRYVISDALAALKSDAHTMKKHAVMRIAVAECCEEYGLFPDEEQLVRFFTSRRELDFSDLSLLNAFLTENALVSLARGGNDREAVATLYKLRNADFSFFVPSVFSAEKALLSVAEFTDMDEKTQNLIRRALCESAKRLGKSPDEVCRELIERSAREKRDFCSLLLRVRNATVFFPLAALIFAFLAFACYAACGMYFLLVLLPLASVSLSLSSCAVMTFKSPVPVLRLKREAVKDVPVLVCVSTLLNGKDEKMFKALERYYCANADCNCTYLVLADLCESDKQEMNRDDGVISAARSAVEALDRKYGCFALAVRHRTKNRAGRYCGRERKRGAIEDLVAYLCGDGIMFRCLTREIPKPEFLLTLDSDTRLSVASVSDMLCAAMHPSNRPVIENNRLLSGFGAFVPRMSASIESYTKSFFSVLTAGDGGVDVYENSSFSTSDAVFGEGLYCGKGLISLKAYRTFVSGVFDEGAVLSHDIPEGALMHTLWLSDTKLTDSAMSSYASYSSRAHRWARGDIQNLFVLKKLKSSCGKYAVVYNALRTFSPAVALISVTLAALLYAAGAINDATANALLFFSLADTLLMPLISVMASPSRIYALTFVRCFSRMAKTGLLDIFRLLWSLASFVDNACVMLSAAVLALYRTAVSSPKLLEWTTSSQSSAAGEGIFAFFGRRALYALPGGVFFFIAPAGVFRLFGLLWFFFPVIAYIVSKPFVKKRHRVNHNDLKKTASLMFRYFDDNVTSKTHFLPPDNVSFSPSRKIAMRTSPTNIGMYLLSLCAAADFSLIDAVTLRAKLTQTLATLEKMERFDGHFYNWYDISDLSVIGGRFVSTVDSGNLVASLVALDAALEEYGLGDLRERFAKIADCDFSSLYDGKRKLFLIGKPDTESENRYDLYMSEARITSYIAVAGLEVPPEHWKKLSRAVVGADGYVGMASWSGTAFEYFMPSLFLPSPDDTFVNESLRFALREQKHYTVNGFWGVSESAYFAFDAEMNYQYKAFGVPSLALKTYSSKDNVISPYSSFLCMPFSPGAARRNLRKLKKSGAFGQYGFYEAYDFSPLRTRNGAVVKSYMAHHVGMSLAALANYCFDGIFVRRFMSDPRMGGACELLEEKIPERTVYRSVIPSGVTRRYDRGERGEALHVPDRNSPVCSLVTNGFVTLESSSIGHIAVICGGYHVNDAIFDRYDSSRTVNITADGTEIVTDAGSFEKKDNSVSYINSSVCASVSAGVSGRCAVFSVLCSEEREIRLSFAPMFDSYGAYASHPAYSLLFLTYETDAENGIMYIRRKFRDGETMYGAIAGEDGGASLSHGHDPSSPVIASVRASKTRFFLTCRKTKEEALLAVTEARNSSVDLNLIERVDGELLASYMYPFGAVSQGQCLGREMLWKYSLSGDYPLMFLKEPSHSELSRSLLFFRSLAIASLRTEMLVLVKNKDRYSREGERDALSVIEECACNGFMNRAGGICVTSSLTPDELHSAEILAYNKPLAVLPACNSQARVVSEPDKSGFLNPPDDALFEVCGGSFGDNSFTVDRSYKHAGVWSFVLTGRRFGTLVTQSSLGFTFFGDSRNCRVSAFPNSPELQHYGERLLVNCDGEYFDAVACSSFVRFSPGIAVYYGAVGGREYSVKVWCCERYPIKFIELSSGCELLSSYTVRLPDAGRNAYCAGSSARAYIPSQKLFCCVACVGNGTPHISAASPFGVEGTVGAIGASSEGNVVYALCAAKSAYALDCIESGLNRVFVDDERERAVRFALSMLPEKKINVKPTLDVMYNCFLPYQVAASRFFARTGFYQSSGAYGFRDQLQDCLMLMHTMPSIVRTHIIRACAHQYAEGDVMHWFIPGTLGTRTKCSDDFMYLPLLTAEYVKTTGDTSLLEVRVAYLVSEPPEGAERCEKPVKGKFKESVYEHCLRAMRRSLSRGSHGLPPIGSCDWNDGFSRLGVKGRGESVLNAEFFVYVTDIFMPLLRERSPSLAEEYLTHRNELCRAVDACFRDGWFLRAYDDDGNAIGAKGNPECEIDLTSQVFAALSGCCDKEKISQSLDNAYDMLFDRKAKILKLLAPPFRGKNNVGYIAAYPPGVRENGGQYTHAAAQTVLALWRSGKKERALELLDALNPALRCLPSSDRRNSMIYGAEPYALCGDVSASGDSVGRGGWSQYTGSAAWYWCAMNEIFGE